jgi:hypothetical protein
MKGYINFLALPALLVHELSHVLMVVLLGVKSQGVDVKGDIKGFEVVVNYKTDSNWKKNIISLAPIGGFIMWCIFICLTSGILFSVLSIYAILYVRVFFPSNEDIQTYQSTIQEEDIEIPEYIK